MVGNGRDCMDIETLIASMDQNRIDQSVLFMQDSYAAINNTEGNDFIARAVEAYPQMFIGFASASPWYGEKAVRELDSRLRSGLFRGVYFKSTVQGFSIEDEIVYPLIEVCQKYAVPAYFHTGTPSMALPFQLMLLAQRYPEVRFIMGHTGCFDFVGDAYASARWQPNIYLETSFALTLFMRAMSLEFPKRTLFGSGAPRSTQAFELQKLTQGVEDAEVLNDILGGNMQRLLEGAK